MLNMLDAKDRELVEFAFETCETILAAYDRVAPFCIVEDDSTQRFTFCQAEGFSDVEAKHEFFVLCRATAAAVAGCRVAIIGESWKIDGTDEALRLEAQRLFAENRLHELPGVRDCITIMLESDEGRGAIAREIDHSTPGWATLRPLMSSDVLWDAWEQTESAQGVFADGAMLLPRPMREAACDDAKAYLEAIGIRHQPMDEFLSLTKRLVKPQA